MSDATEADADKYLEAVHESIIPKPTAGAAPGDRSAYEESALQYDIPDRPLPPPIPNGWYSISDSASLTVGDIRSVIAVGRELVAYRDKAGVPHVIDAHCPHLGAHLGGGWISEEGINCPYHGWKFGPDGNCVEIPYSDSRIPSRACVPKYEVRETNGFVFFWYHAGDKAPQYEIPYLIEQDEEDWTEPHPWGLELKAALGEMAENNVDYAHLHFVHRRPNIPNDTSVFNPDGYFSEVIESLPEGPSFVRYTHGPGIALLRITDLMTIYSTTTPIDRFHARLNWHFYFPKKMESSASVLMEGVTGDYGLLADIPIWNDKIYKSRPVLVKGDGNIAEFRQWFSQFYEGSDWEP